MATMQTGKLYRMGASGDDVRALQRKLHRLGFPLAADGIFGDETEKVVIQLQTLFGYTVDGIVGAGTMRLIDTQIASGWSAELPNAQELAMRAQGKDFGLPTGRMGDRATNQNTIEFPRSPSLPGAARTATPDLTGPTYAPGTKRPAGAPGSIPGKRH